MYEPLYHPKFNRCMKHQISLNYAVDTPIIIHSDKWNADPPHLHPFLEILFFHNNETSFLHGDSIYRVCGRSAVISKPNEIHMCIFNSEQTYNITALWIDGDLSDSLFSFLYRPDYHPLFRFDEETFSHLNRCLKSLTSEAGSLTHFADMVRILALFEESKGECSSDIVLPSILQNVIDDISEYCSSIRSVGDLLERHYVSQATLNRYFQKYLHISAQEYLLSQRLLVAAQLLTQGCSVTDACMQAGFTDCSRFIVQFKRKFSVTPKQYPSFIRQHASNSLD